MDSTVRNDDDYYGYSPTPGSGVIKRTNSNPLIHFGSPAGEYEWVVQRKRWWRW